MKTSPTANSPLNVGLSSHPDLNPTQFPQLIDSVLSFLRELKQHLPNTDVRVMVDARGDANLAIARAVLELGLFVDALIAAPIQDQATDSDATSTRDLLNHPRVRGVEMTAGDSLTPGSTLMAIFADIVVRRSSLLIALWDGKASRARHDTADTVFHFLGVPAGIDEAVHRIEIAKVSDDPDVSAKLVYWVPVVRNGAEALDSIQHPHFLLAAGDNFLEVQQTMPSLLKRRLADLNEYNLEYERFIADGSGMRSDSLMRNLSEEIPASDAFFLENIDSQFVKADSLAGHMQGRSDRLFNLFGIMAFTMGVAYLIYDKITESRILLIVYMVILFTSLLAYYSFQDKHWFGRHLAYRALAETLRVRFYLALAGLDRRMHTGELIALTGIYKFRGFGWISFVLSSVETTAVETGHTGETYLRWAHLVDQVWIEDQYRYFARKVAKMQKAQQRVKRLKGAVFIVVLAVISTMFVFGESLNHVDALTGLPVKNVMTFCSGFLAVLLGVWELRQNKMATQELLWQYRSQLSRFERARMQLRRVTSRGRRDDVLTELGESSLMEIYLWAIHRYHREHAPPAASA
jgi:hypothetical protein